MRNRLFNFLIISKIFIFYQINAQTWTQIFSNQSKNLHAVEFANDSIGWIMGNDGIILYTNNSGNSWSTQTSGTTKNLMDLHVFNKDTVVAVGEDAVFLYTLNGGTSWTVQTVNMNYGGSFNIDYFYAIHGHNEVANTFLYRSRRRCSTLEAIFISYNDHGKMPVLEIYLEVLLLQVQFTMFIHGLMVLIFMHLQLVKVHLMMVSYKEGIREVKK